MRKWLQDLHKFREGREEDGAILINVLGIVIISSLLMLGMLSLVMKFSDYNHFFKGSFTASGSNQTGGSGTQSGGGTGDTGGGSGGDVNSNEEQALANATAGMEAAYQKLTNLYPTTTFPDVNSVETALQGMLTTWQSDSAELSAQSSGAYKIWTIAPGAFSYPTGNSQGGAVTQSYTVEVTGYDGSAQVTLKDTFTVTGVGNGSRYVIYTPNRLNVKGFVDATGVVDAQKVVFSNAQQSQLHFDQGSELDTNAISLDSDSGQGWKWWQWWNWDSDQGHSASDDITGQPTEKAFSSIDALPDVTSEVNNELATLGSYSRTSANDLEMSWYWDILQSDHNEYTDSISSPTIIEGDLIIPNGLTLSTNSPLVVDGDLYILGSISSTSKVYVTGQTIFVQPPTFSENNGLLLYSTGNITVIANSVWDYGGDQAAGQSAFEAFLASAGNIDMIGPVDLSGGLYAEGNVSLDTTSEDWQGDNGLHLGWLLGEGNGGDDGDSGGGQGGNNGMHLGWYMGEGNGHGQGDQQDGNQGGQGDQGDQQDGNQGDQGDQHGGGQRNDQDGDDGQGYNQSTAQPMVVQFDDSHVNNLLAGTSVTYSLSVLPMPEPSAD